jgi:hypothetical protein
MIISSFLERLTELEPRLAKRIVHLKMEYTKTIREELRIGLAASDNDHSVRQGN